MTITEFTALLTAKHPQATAARSTDTGGATVKIGLTVTFDGGKMYHYQGSFYAIAQAIGLIEKWYVLENGCVVDQATSEEEANEKCCVKVTQAIELTNKWGGSVGEFTIRKAN